MAIDEDNYVEHIEVSLEFKHELDKLFEIIQEKNESMPYSFALCCHLLGLTITEVARLADNKYDDVRGDLRQLLDAVLGYNDRPTTYH